MGTSGGSAEEVAGHGCPLPLRRSGPWPEATGMQSGVVSTVAEQELL